MAIVDVFPSQNGITRELVFNSEGATYPLANPDAYPQGGMLYPTIAAFGASTDQPGTAVETAPPETFSEFEITAGTDTQRRGVLIIGGVQYRNFVCLVPDSGIDGTLWTYFVDVDGVSNGGVQFVGPNTIDSGNTFLNGTAYSDGEVMIVVNADAADPSVWMIMLWDTVGDPEFYYAFPSADNIYSIIEPIVSQGSLPCAQDAGNVYFYGEDNEFPFIVSIAKNPISAVFDPPNYDYTANRINFTGQPFDSSAGANIVSFAGIRNGEWYWHILGGDGEDYLVIVTQDCSSYRAYQFVGGTPGSVLGVIE